MDFSAALLITLNDVLVCLLPLIFFRRGKFTFMWLITAAPYGVAPIITWCVYYRVLMPSIDYVSSGAIIGVALSVLSILMMGLTLGSHRIPLALWHQKPENDAPQHIVDWGIYRRIRHPFYSSFIVLILANTLIAQNVLALAVLIYVLILLTFTAKKEESRLSAEAGTIGEHYRNYMTTTGRFFPRLFVAG